jgi:hypothetical protein
MTDQEKNVCSNSWTGKHNENITLKNQQSNVVTVSPCTNPTGPWPFSSPSSAFTVPAKVGSTPGTQTVTLQNAPGDYCYKTTGCPGDPKEVNPKTVIIT